LAQKNPLLQGHQVSMVDGDISSKVQFAEEIALAKENRPSRGKRIRIAIKKAGTRQASWTKSVDNRGCGENTLALAEIYIHSYLPSSNAIKSER
jgi:hypothetical protein